MKCHHHRCKMDAEPGELLCRSHTVVSPGVTREQFQYAYALMKGSFTLKQAAVFLGMRTQELDVALWRWLGAEKPWKDAA